MDLYGRNGSQNDPNVEWAPAGPETGLEGISFFPAFEFHWLTLTHLMRFSRVSVMLEFLLVAFRMVFYFVLNELFGM